MAFTTAPKAEESSREKTNNASTDLKAPQGAGPYADIDVGAVVDVKGELSTFRDERQINIEKMVLVKTTAQELVLWEKRNKFHREILNVPWVLREKDILRCRKEAEKSGTRERSKKRQKQQAHAVAEGQRARRQAIQPEAKVGSRREGIFSGGAGESVREMIQRDVAKGKYSALGL